MFACFQYICKKNNTESSKLVALLRSTNQCVKVRAGHLLVYTMEGNLTFLPSKLPRMCLAGSAKSAWPAIVHANIKPRNLHWNWYYYRFKPLNSWFAAPFKWDTTVNAVARKVLCVECFSRILNSGKTINKDKRFVRQQWRRKRRAEVVLAIEISRENPHAC